VHLQVIERRVESETYLHMRVGDEVNLAGSRGHGWIRFAGPTGFAGGVWIGVELGRWWLTRALVVNSFVQTGRPAKIKARDPTESIILPASQCTAFSSAKKPSAQ
jgi:hypothetical protein